MEGNVRLFLLLYLMPSNLSHSLVILRGLRTRLLIFYQDHVLLIRRLVGLLVPGLSSVSTTFSMLSVEPEPWYDVVKWLCKSLWMSQILSKHLQPLCYPSHPRFLNSLMHLQIPSFRSDVALGQFNHTNQWVEVLYCLDIYVGAIVMTLGVLASHLVI